MSSSRTAPTSTTASSTSLPSRTSVWLPDPCRPGQPEGWPARPSRMRALFEAEPGTYVLTDYLVRSFQRTVVAGLGLDAHPELWPDYFRHYRRVVWLAQDRSAPMQAEAEQVAARFGLPLTVIETGTGRLEAELARLVGDETGPCTETAARPPAHSAP